MKYMKKRGSIEGIDRLFIYPTGEGAVRVLLSQVALLKFNESSLPQPHMKCMGNENVLHRRQG